MSAEAVAFIGALCFAHTDLIPVPQEHLDEMSGEILPHLVMSDIIRWMVLNYKDDPSTVKEILVWMSDAAQQYDKDQEIIDLIGVFCFTGLAAGCTQETGSLANLNNLESRRHVVHRVVVSGPRWIAPLASVGRFARSISRDWTRRPRRTCQAPPASAEFENAEPAHSRWSGT